MRAGRALLAAVKRWFVWRSVRNIAVGFLLTHMAFGAVGAGQGVTIRIQSTFSEINLARFQLVKEAFEAKHPHIKLELAEQPSDTETASWTDITLVAIVAGTAPDVFQTWGPFHVDWAERGLLLELNRYIERDFTAAEIADYFPPTWLGGELCCGENRGLRFAVPRYVNVGVTWYNIDHFNEAGLVTPDVLYRQGAWTWEALREAARRLTVRSDDQVRRWGVIDRMLLDTRWAGLVHAAGGSVSSWPYEPLQMTVDTPEVQAAWEFQRDLRHVDQSMPATPRVHSLDLFINEQASMALGDGTAALGNAFTTRIAGAFNWNIVPDPAGPSGKHVSWTAADSWSINAFTPHPDEAWEVVKFLTRPEGAALWNFGSERIEGPARYSLAEAYAERLPAPLHAWAHFDAATHAVLMPDQYLPGAAQLRQLFYEALDRSVVDNRVAIEVTLAEIQPVAQALLEEGLRIQAELRQTGR